MVAAQTCANGHRAKIADRQSSSKQTTADALTNDLAEHAALKFGLYLPISEGGASVTERQGTIVSIALRPSVGQIRVADPFIY